MFCCAPAEVSRSCFSLFGLTGAESTPSFRPPARPRLSAHSVPGISRGRQRQREH